MQTRLPDSLLATPLGQEADAILRSCVHCGFCNATCPTYQLLGDELDGPRGRIYLMKQMLEGRPVSALTRGHLDRCLTCRNCETTCPSGVQYGRLIDLGREMVERLAPRPAPERLMRAGLRKALANGTVFGTLLKVGRGMSWALPATLQGHLPSLQKGGRGDFASGSPLQAADKSPPAPLLQKGASQRRMLLLTGCVQPALAPETNTAATRVLTRLGIHLFAAPEAGCCGALSQHLGAAETAKAAMRRNIDAWWPHLEAGAEAIVMTASGCGSLVKEYGHLLRDDPAYAAKAARVSGLTRDLAEVLAREDLSAFRTERPRPIAFHPPCSLQHGQKVRGVIEGILSDAGFQLLPVAESHLCCGSAGTYSLLQPELSNQLRERKLAHLQAPGPALIATANVGCQTHLAAASGVPVVHWIELLEPGG